MKKILLLSIFCFFISTVLSAQSKDLQTDITKENVRYLISTLSADSMMGRQTFAPSIHKSAKFIASQFRKIGLEPMKHDGNYFQHFKVFNINPRNSKLKLKGQLLYPSSYFVVTNQEEIHWRYFSSEKIHLISESSDFRSEFTKLNHLENDAIILVNEAHKNIFEHYKRHFSQASETMNLNQGHTKLFILTNAKQVDNSSFDQSSDVTKLSAFNIAGKITGTSQKNEYVIFSAHYDHLGILIPVKGDSIANGADDDASGTAAVIMLANYYKKLGPQKRTLLFVTFTGEEEGGYGSQYFSKQMNPDQVIAMFNIEMIGKPSKFGPDTAFLTGFGKTDMGKILQAGLENSPYKIYPDPYPRQHLFYRSDNARLARLGVPAHTISSNQIDKDPYYHTVNDEPETLDIDHLTHMIRAIAISSENIVSGRKTPSRLDVSSLH